MDELIEAFDISGLSKSPAIFDIDKLDLVQRTNTSRRMHSGRLSRAGRRPWFDKVLARQDTWIYRTPGQPDAAPALRSSTGVPDQMRFLAELPEYDIELYTHKKMKTDPEISLKALKLALPVLEALEDFSEENVKAVLMELAQKNEMKTGQIMWPVRIAISGLQSTPGGATEIAYLLGKDETLRRMKLGVEKLEKR